MDTAKRENDYETNRVRESSKVEITTAQRKVENLKVAEDGEKDLEGKRSVRKDVQARAAETLLLTEAQIKAEAMVREAKASLARVKAEAWRRRVELVMQEESTTAKSKAELLADLQSQIAAAKAEADGQVKVADATKEWGQVEEASTAHLVRRRQWLEEMRETEVIVEMAKAKDVNFIGKRGDQVVEALLQGSIGFADGTIGDKEDCQIQ
mmetsp:Transcript_140010/g.314369  ORF Transcript_140010/g.314369 Transcript_140010/m.314369 type:complete len:210 (+) Transcript_140010:1-630(+)